MTDTNTVTVLGKIRVDESTGHGGAAIVYEIISAPSLEAAQEWAAVARPAYGCTHAHDCCGRWYPNDAEILPIETYPIDPRFLVTQTWYQNV